MLDSNRPNLVFCLRRGMLCSASKCGRDRAVTGAERLGRRSAAPFLESAMRSVCAALGWLAVLLSASLLPAQEKPKEVSPQETIQFEQDKAQAHMRELEQRMFRLAELIRDAQPEDAARLKLG